MCKHSNLTAVFSINPKTGEPFKTCDRCREVSSASKRRNYHKEQEVLGVTPRNPIEVSDEVKEIRRLLYAANRKNPDMIIRKKINQYKRNDRAHKREFEDSEFVTKDWIMERYNEQDGQCLNCNTEIKLHSFTANAFNQLSIHRVDGAAAHTMDNCQLLCWGCNHEIG